MKRAWIALFLAASLPLFAQEKDWPPSKDLTDKGKRLKNPTAGGRQLEIFQHGARPEWGYKAPQRDTFVVIHPKKAQEQARLYVVLHSAGHDVISCVQCTRTVGNHDIYHAPDDFYALYLDCRANRGDWWWGGMHRRDARLTKKNSGATPAPVEKRVIDTISWVIRKYQVDKNRVYLCGNSMGGSGTLGIGMRRGDVFAAIKANVPAGIEHVSHRMGFPPQAIPQDIKLPDPPIVINYSAQNDGWSVGHDLFAKSMENRRYALFFYWGPFGHANNHSRISKVNDLINSFDWLEVRKEQRSGVYMRQPGAGPETEGSAELRPVSLFDLLAVYKHVIDNVPDNLVHQILEEEISVEECIENILAVLERDARVNFTDLLQSRNRQALIATFVGILELLKSQRIRVQQARPFDEIWIEGRKGGSPLVITSDRGAQEREQ